MKMGQLGKWTAICLLAGALSLLCVPAIASAEVKPVDLSFLTGGRGGSYYPAGGSLCDLLQKKCPVVKSASVQVTAASVENARLMQAGKGRIGLISSQTTYYAARSMKPFKKKQDKLRSLGWAHSSMKHWIVRKGSGIKSIRDSKGKRVSTAAPGSAAMLSNRAMLKFYGILPKDIDERMLSYREAADALKDGRIDVVGGLGTSVPGAIVTELATTMDIDLISVPPFMLEQFVIIHPYFRWGKIPAGSYKGVDYDVYNSDSKATFMASIDLPEEVVYEIMKTIYENKDWLMKYGHRSFKTWDWGDPTIDRVAPLHPGAVKFYREIGKLKD